MIQTKGSKHAKNTYIYTCGPLKVIPSAPSKTTPAFKSFQLTTMNSHGTAIMVPFSGMLKTV